VQTLIEWLICSVESYDQLDGQLYGTNSPRRGLAQHDSQNNDNKCVFQGDAFPFEKARIIAELELSMTPEDFHNPSLFPKWLHVLAPKNHSQVSWGFLFWA
jgi:hypothetical protein